MRAPLAECLTTLEGALRAFERMVPQPQLVEMNGVHDFRYVEQTIRQALLLKFVRYVSGLNAVAVLVGRGLVLEAGATQRILDEIREDIGFLAIAATGGEVSDKNKERLLSAFWAEPVMDRGNPMARAAKSDVPRRSKIRSPGIALAGSANPSALHDAAETISAIYSGFVHASAQHTMDIYGHVAPRRIHVSGVPRGDILNSYEKDAENVFFRGITAAQTVAKALGDAEGFESLRSYEQRFEEQCGGDLVSPVP
jgi:hypothetical protein